MNTNTTRLSKVLDRSIEIADSLNLAPDGKVGLAPVWEIRDAWQDDPHASPYAELTVATRPDEARVTKILKYADMPAYSQPERPGECTGGNALRPAYSAWSVSLTPRL